MISAHGHLVGLHPGPAIADAGSNKMNRGRILPKGRTAVLVEMTAQGITLRRSIHRNRQAAHNCYRSRNTAAAYILTETELRFYRAGALVWRSVRYAAGQAIGVLTTSGSRVLGAAVLPRINVCHA